MTLSVVDDSVVTRATGVNERICGVTNEMTMNECLSSNV
jgi:hypothetical protein